MTSDQAAYSLNPDPRQVAAWLRVMEPGQFRKIVEDDISGSLDEEAATGLRDYKVRKLWLAMIKVILSDVNTQLQASGRDQEWRQKALRYRQHVLERRVEATRLCQEPKFVHAISEEESLRAMRARGEAREAALKRLVEHHREEFKVLMAEERARCGIGDDDQEVSS